MNRKQLIKAYRELHGGAQFNGYTLIAYKDQVWEALRQSKAKTVLDWGAGKGEAWKEWTRVCDLESVYCYDPGVKGKDIPPGDGVKFDLVVCCDVLEHLHPDDADATIARLFSHARRGIWISTCSRPAKKFFPGTEVNMHTCLLPYETWAEKFAAANKSGIPVWHVNTP